MHLVQYLKVTICDYGRDLEKMETPVFSVKAHDALINCMDGAGGYGIQCGAPELVTGSRDGTKFYIYGLI